MYQLEIYMGENGKSEIESYLEILKKLDDKESKVKRDKIFAYMRMLQLNGLSLGKPYIKHIDGEIWELRPLRERILFAYVHNNKFILLSIFMKKTEKTPRREIEKAKKLLKIWKRRWEENGEIQNMG